MVSLISTTKNRILSIDEIVRFYLHPTSQTPIVNKMTSTFETVNFDIQFGDNLNFTDIKMIF